MKRMAMAGGYEAAGAQPCEFDDLPGYRRQDGSLVHGIGVHGMNGIGVHGIGANGVGMNGIGMNGIGDDSKPTPWLVQTSLCRNGTMALQSL
jgi:hypothetical protein